MSCRVSVGNVWSRDGSEPTVESERDDSAVHFEVWVKMFRFVLFLLRRRMSGLSGFYCSFGSLPT